MRKRWLCSGLLALAAAFSQATSAGSGLSPKPAPLYFYASEFSLPGVQMACAQRTIETIRAAIAPRELRVVQLTSIADVDRVFREPGAFVAVVGASTYWRHLRDGIRDIATLVTTEQPDPDHAVGALVVVKASRSDITTLADLRGKRIAVNDPIGFQGIQVVYRELVEAGFEWRGFFSEVKALGLDYRLRLDALRKSEVDAATVNVCYVERMREKGINVLAGLKPISVQKQSFARCMTSTRLYPNWNLLSSPELDSATRIKIANAIYAMPATEDGQRWTMASDFRETDELYRTLKTGPYSYLNAWTLRRIWSEYRLLVVLLFFGVLFSIWHMWRTGRIVVTKTAQLREALAEQKALARHVSELSRRYEQTRRVLTVSQISSLVAHEISQPLSGILLYARGIQDLVLNDTSVDKKELLLASIDKISARARKANDIVGYVRAIAKRSDNIFHRVDLIKVVHLTIEHLVCFGKLRKEACRILASQEQIYILGSELELEVAVNNILENSIQAIGNEKLQLTIECVQKENYAHLSIVDNGVMMTEALAEKLSEPLFSTKAEGLGLGLSLVKCIVERHAGSIKLAATPEGALCVTILLPLE